jgi:iron complex transport system substrate-binding protein
VRLALVSLLIATLPIQYACDDPDVAQSDASPQRHSRIVTLAPSLAELVFAAGAGEFLVGVSAYSDFPPQVEALPLVGDAFTIDQEQLALLQPDLLLVWKSGTPEHIVDELRIAGYAVETIRTQMLADIPAALIRIGELTGRDERAEQVAAEFNADMQALAQKFAGSEPIRVFYQVSQRPLYTVSSAHYASELIALCGGSNVFSDLDELAPAIDVEAVIDRDPEAMLAGRDSGDDAFSEWSRWPRIAANRYDNHFLLPGDELGRPTPRVLAAGVAICEALQTARERRAAHEESDGA